MYLVDRNFKPADPLVTLSELWVATADRGDEKIDNAVQEVLKLLRDRLGMDVVFVFESVVGRVHSPESAGKKPETEGDGLSLEEGWGKRVLIERLTRLHSNSNLVSCADPLVQVGQGLPEALASGQFLSTRVVLRFGRHYGTLCFFSRGCNEKMHRLDLKHLKFTAQLMAGKIYFQPRRHDRNPQASGWTLEPVRSTFTRLL